MEESVRRTENTCFSDRIKNIICCTGLDRDIKIPKPSGQSTKKNELKNMQKIRNYIYQRRAGYSTDHPHRTRAMKRIRTIGEHASPGWRWDSHRAHRRRVAYIRFFPFKRKIKQFIKGKRDVFKYSGQKLAQERLPNKLLSLVFGFFWKAWIVLHISTRR